MAVRRRIPNNPYLKIHSILFKLNNREALSDQVSKTPFNEMTKSKLENFLLSLDLSLPRGGWHIVCVTHGWIRQMVEGSSVAHDPLEFFGEPPKEDARPSVPMPIRRSRSTKKTVLNCSQVPGVAIIRSPPPHCIPREVNCPPSNCKPPKYDSCVGLHLCLQRGGPVKSTSAKSV